MLLLHLIHLPFSFSASVWPQTMDSAMDGNANFADLEALEPDVKVPFYIYQTPAMRKLYDGCQRTALSILDGRWPPHLPKGMGDVNRKNYDEVFWLDQLWNDSWRTFDPEDALVFVIPVYPVLSLEQACEGDRNQTHALAEAAVREIMQLPYFGRNEGLDHIVMGIDWRFTHTKNKSIKRAFGRRFAALAKKISWGRKVAERGYGHIGCAVTSPFTSVLTFLQKGNQPFEKESLLERGLIDARDVFEDNCIHTARNPPSKHDWFARDYSMFFQGQTSFRRGYIYRRLAFQHLVGWNFTAKSCLRQNITCRRNPNVFVSSSTNKLLNLVGSDTQMQQLLPNCPRQANERLLFDDASFGGHSQEPGLGKFEGCRLQVSTKDANVAARRAATFLHRLANSKLNLCFRGDDVTSSRYVDGFRSRTLNVLITEAEEMFKYAMPFQVPKNSLNSLCSAFSASLSAKFLGAISPLSLMGLCSRQIPERL